MSNGWSQERKAKQAKAIRRWAPWNQSTGPKTDGGKAKASRNAFKGGALKNWREMMKAMKQLLKDQNESLEK